MNLIIPTSLCEAAEYYASTLGWPVFPLCEREKKPFLSGGFKIATIDLDQIKEWWFHWPNANIGIPCGEKTFIVLDVDKHKGGDESLQALEEKHGKLPETLTQRTGSGGLHLLFLPDPRVGNSESKIGIGIDTRGNDKGFIVVAPSIHENGNAYQWENQTDLQTIPEWIVELLNPKSESGDLASPIPANADASFNTWKFEQECGNDIVERAKNYLAECPGAIEGQGGHSALLWACTVLVHGFGLDDQTAHNLLSQEYNPRCSPPWDLGDPRQFKDFTRKIQEAKKNNQKPYKWLIDEYEREKQARIDVEISHGRGIADVLLKPLDDYLIIDNSEIEKVRINDFEVEPIPLDLLTPVGLVGDIVSLITRTALWPQPLMGIGASLAFCGALFGRKVQDESRLRTNIYAIGVAKSGAGKEQARKVIKEICTDAGIAPNILGGEEFTSDAAIAACLEIRPSVFFPLDEIGHIIASCKDKFSDSHRRGIVPFLMRLFSSANTLFLGKEYANGIRKDIDQPNVCFYGTTGPKVFYRGLSSDEIEDGLLGRLLIFQSEERERNNNPMSLKVPIEIAEKCAWWMKFMPPAPEGMSDIISKTRAHQITILIDTDAETRFSKFLQEIKHENNDMIMEPLWIRAEEHSKKIALIISAGDCKHPKEAKITAEHADYACRLVLHLTKKFILLTRNCIADSEVERISNKIIRMVKESKTQGIIDGDIARKMRGITKKQRQDAIQTLLDGGWIINKKYRNTYKYYFPHYGATNERNSDDNTAITESNAIA